MLHLEIDIDDLDGIVNMKALHDAVEDILVQTKNPFGEPISFTLSGEYN